MQEKSLLDNDPSEKLSSPDLTRQGDHEQRYNFKTISRIAAIQAVYAHLITGEDLLEMDSNVLNSYRTGSVMESELININTKHHGILINEVGLNMDSIRKIIEEYIKEPWSIEKLHLLLISILIVGAAEIIHLHAPFKVVVNEFSNIASDFLLENEVNFVNSVLDKIGKRER